MLSDYTLDTETYREIMEEAKNMVVSLYPEWSDFNYHDPGITLLELFAWLKEGQQYFLDQIGNEHKKKYLKLLGISPMHRQGAGALLHVEATEDCIIRKGTKFGAGRVCFEADRTRYIPHNSIIECFSGNKKLVHACKRERLRSKDDLNMYLFGESVQKGDAFYVGFSEELKPWEEIGIYIQLDKKTQERRNLKKEKMHVPMLRLKYQYYTKGVWKEIEEVVDSTDSMIRDGMLFICLHQPMERVKVFDREAYYMRIQVEEGDMDISPVLQKIEWNVIKVSQKDTWAEYQKKQVTYVDGRGTIIADTYLGREGQNELFIEREQLYYRIPVYEKAFNFETGEAEISFDMPKQKGNMLMKQNTILMVNYAENGKVNKCIGIGSGFPYQEYDLGSVDVIANQVEILVHEIGTGNGYCRWERVEDFGKSAPEDKHFMVDNKEGKIIFGDCEHGMAPEGEILLISFAETLGEDGNVKKGKIDSFLQTPIDGVFVKNEMDAEMGKDEENLEECFFRARKNMKHPDTAVTYEDYERYVKETPGLIIESCKVIPTDDVYANEINIVVKAVGGTRKKELSESYRKNILAHLEQYRMLGTKINIVSPRYVPMELCLDIVTKPHFLDARNRIEQVIGNYFSNLSQQFGAIIVYSELYGILDMLDCVAQVNEIALDIKDGNITRTQDGNIILPPNGIIELKNVQYLLSLSD